MLPALCPCTGVQPAAAGTGGAATTAAAAGAGTAAAAAAAEQSPLKGVQQRATWLVTAVRGAAAAAFLPGNQLRYADSLSIQPNSVNLPMSVHNLFHRVLNSSWHTPFGRAPIEKSVVNQTLHAASSQLLQGNSFLMRPCSKSGASTDPRHNASPRF
jgi:hypothetical protein